MLVLETHGKAVVEGHREGAGEGRGERDSVADAEGETVSPPLPSEGVALPLPEGEPATKPGVGAAVAVTGAAAGAVRDTVGAHVALSERDCEAMA